MGLRACTTAAPAHTRPTVQSYYRPEAYVVALLFVEIPWLALQVLIYQAISYPMVREVAGLGRAVVCTASPVTPHTD